MTRRTPGGSILLLVLVVIAVLALGANTYLDLVHTEHMAVRRHGRASQALRMSESGVEYLKTFIVQSPAAITNLGGLTDNVAHMRAQIADDQASEFDRGRFSILCPAQLAGLYNGYRSGLEDESAKLNLHVLLAEGAEDEARNRLLPLPGMTPEVADAILDWLDADSMPREFGAEQDYYAALDPPYTMRNGPIADLDELFMIRGVTPELLYGYDRNRNYLVDADEAEPRGALVEIDNAEGVMNRGWSAYLTVASVELMEGRAAPAKLDLNSPDLQTLYNSLKSAIGDEHAKFIILYRQYGQPAAADAGRGDGQSGSGGSSGTPAGSGSNGRQPGGGQTGGPQRGRDAGGNNGAANGSGGETVPAGSIALNFQQPGGTQIASLLDLVGASVQVPAATPAGEDGQSGGGSGGGQSGSSPSQGDGDSGENSSDGDDDENPAGDDDSGGGSGEGGSGGSGAGGENGGSEQPPQTVVSPWTDNSPGYQDLAALADVAVAAAPGRVAGRVNINAASRIVLLTIPGISLATVEQILAVRQLEPHPAASPQRHALWLLTEGVMQLDQFRELERFITTGGDAYSGQSVGFFDGDSTPVRGEFVLDRSVKPARLRHWRDLKSWGPGFTPDQLGAAPPK